MLFRILKKDIRRKKTMNLILLLFVILATMFVASGLSNVMAVLNGTDYYLDKAGLGDYVVITQGEGCFGRLGDQLKDVKEAKSYRLESYIALTESDLSHDGKKVKSDSTMMITNIDDDGLLYFDKDNQEITEVKEGHIYVQLRFLNKNDLKVGDTLHFSKEGVELDFVIDGTFKDACLGSDMMGNNRFLICGKDMEKIVADETIRGKWGGDLAYVDTDDVKEFAAAIADLDGISFDGARSTIKLTYVLSLIIAFVVLILSVALIIVSFVVLRFAINLSVMEDFHEIGVMKAIGIRNRKIRGMYAAKYLALAVLGVLIGGALSFPFGQMLIKSVSENMVLGNDSDTAAHLIGGLAVVLIITGFAWLCTRKVKKLSPVDAIRSGQTGERFRKKKTRGSGKVRKNTEFFLATNDLWSNPKRYLSVFLSIFICTLLVLMIVNITATMKSDSFVESFGARRDLYVDDIDNLRILTGTGREEFEAYIREKEKLLSDAGMPCVISDEIQYKYPVIVDGNKYKLDLQQGINITSDEYSYMEGSAPQNVHEAAITTPIMEKTGLKLGDTFTVDYGDHTEDYLVTATFQSMNQMGLVIRLHQDAETDFSHIGSTFGFGVKFTDNPSKKEIEARKEKIKEVWGVEDLKVMNAAEFCDDCMKSADSMEAVQNLLLLITLIVVILVTVLMERSFASDEKTQIALLKAVGFRNKSIVKWHVWRFAICSFFAVLLALAVSIPVTNLVATPIFGMMGLDTVDYRYNVSMTLAYPGIIFGFTILVTWIVAQCTRRIKSSDTANIE